VRRCTGGRSPRCSRPVAPAPSRTQRPSSCSAASSPRG
jgi:hypothetical protein